MSEHIERQISLEEERPIIEFPTLVILMIIFGSFIIGLTAFLLPWYFAILAFFALATLIAIFFDPYIGLFAFLVGSLLHPVEFFADVLGPLHLSRNLAFGILLMWIFHTLVYRDFKIVKTKQNVFVFLFGATLLVATLKYFDYSFPNFLESIKLLILYFLVINLVKTRKKFLIIIWGLVLLGFVACLIGIFQHIKGIGIDYGDGLVRIRGTALDPNDYAMHLIILIPITIGLFFNYRNIIAMIFLLLSFILLVINTIFTYSRVGMISLALILIVSLFKVIFQRHKKVSPLILIVISLVILIPFIPSQYWKRAKTISDFNDFAIQARLDVWETGIEMIKDHPFIGIGPGLFRYEYLLRAYMSSEEKTRIPLFSHNAYIQIGAETGVFGLLFFLLLLFFSWQDLKKAENNFKERNDLLYAGLALNLRLALLGYSICAFFLTQAFLTMLWIILPLAVILKKFSLELEDGTK